jgi:glutamine amidotransferase
MIDSGGANLASVGYAFERLGVEVTITHDATQILAAERVLLPGVGNAASIMARLNEYELVPVIRSLTCPVLGIIPGKVESLSAARELPVPHMGWNSIRVRHVDPLLQGLGEDDWFYFVHGYVAPLSLRHTLGSTIYGQEFPSVVRQSNFWGVQFHPERSGKSGARLLANFLKLSPCV